MIQQIGSSTENFPQMGSADYLPGMPDDFGDVLKGWLKVRGMTSREFARRVDKPISTISRIVNGKGTPNPDWLKPWGKVLGLHDADLDNFVALGRTARAKGKKDGKDRVNELEEALEAALSAAGLGQSVLLSFIQFAAQENIKLPRDLQEKMARLNEAMDAIT